MNLENPNTKENPECDSGTVIPNEVTESIQTSDMSKKIEDRPDDFLTNDAEMTQTETKIPEFDFETKTTSSLIKTKAVRFVSKLWLI